MRNNSSWDLIIPAIINDSGMTPRAVLKACLFYMKMRQAKFRYWKKPRGAELKAIKMGLDRLIKLDHALDHEEPE